MESGLHVLVATTSDGRKVKYPVRMSWGDAISSWQRCDDARRQGVFPHVAFFAVRSESDQDWIAAHTDLGSPCAMDHLVAKGYASRRCERGPRGGEHYYYRASVAGLVEAARIRERGLKVGGR